MVGPENSSFHIHEVMLHGCPVFQKMLEPNKFKEGQDRVICLPDTDPQNFLAVAEFFYLQDYFPYRKPSASNTSLGASNQLCIESVKDSTSPRKQQSYARSGNSIANRNAWVSTEYTHRLFLRELQIYLFADKYNIEELQACVVGRVKDLYPINLREIFALAGMFSCSVKLDKELRGFLRSKVRERKSDLCKELQWRDLVESGVDTGLTWEVIAALSS